MNRSPSKATGMSSKESSRKTSADLPPLDGRPFDGRQAKPKLIMTVAARTVGGQAWRPETTPANEK